MKNKKLLINNSIFKVLAIINPNNLKPNIIED